MQNSLVTAGNPRNVITTFLFRRSLPGALFWGALFGLAVLSSSLGFIQAFPTAREKTALALSFGNNVGLKVLLGTPRAIDTVLGFTQWRALGVTVIMGGIWGFLHSTRLLRGDEDEGRWELLLSGATTQRRAALEALTGMGGALAVLFSLVFLLILAIGRIPAISLTLRSTFFFALALSASPALFMATGALTSQMAPSRRHAMLLAAAFFGLSFVLRALSDATPQNDWLRAFSPLGWIEQLQPLTGLHAVWFLPIVLYIALASALTVTLAGQRDLGASLMQEREPRHANTRLLNSHWGLALRLNQGGILGWVITTALASLAFGSITKSAAQAFAHSQTISQLLGRITHLAENAALFLGLIFMLLILLVMIMVAGNLAGIREEEARSHLDNLLVRRVSRLQWLAGRLSVVVLGIFLCGMTIGLVSWLSIHAQGLDISLSRMLLAGLNTMFPSLFLLGAGTLVFGLAPRLVSPVAYGIIVLSFLIQFLASALNVNEWLLNLSVLHHVALAPATDPNWRVNGVLALMGLIAAGLGAYFFSQRDVTVE